MLLSEGTLDLDLGTRAESMITEMAKSQDPKVVSFSPDLSCIRIGPRVFVKEKTGNYVDLNDLDLMTEESSPYFEHVELQKSNLVLASRTRLSAIIPTHDRKRKPLTAKAKEKPDADAASKEQVENVSPDESKDKLSSETVSPSKDQTNVTSDGEADDESAISSSIPESSAWNSAEESWSEASSDAGEDVDAAIATLESSEEEPSEALESDTDSDSDSKSLKDDSSDAPVATQGGLLGDSDDDGEEQNLDWLDELAEIDGEPQEDMDAIYDANDESEYWSSDDDAIIRSYGRSRAKRLGPKRQQGVLMVYDLNHGHPVQLFKFSHLLTTVLDNSPPAIHPTKPLVVWPLSGGDILFADYRANSYFIRKFKPSTRKGMNVHLSGGSQRLSNNTIASHEFVKCHFSPCGKYLHIASLESLVQPITKKELKKGTTPTTLLSAFISTHRLSKRKSTRTPPLLIHRVKISLGKQSSPEIPIQLTWSPNQAFISSSSPSNNLSLFRVELFAPPKGEKKDLVCCPREALLLPKSARSAAVHYFPPRPQETRAMIAIGSSSTNDKDDEAKTDTKTNKNEKPLHNEKSKDEKATDHVPNANNDPKSDPTKAIEQKEENPEATQKSKDTPKDKPKFSQPLIIYLSPSTDLGGWVLSDAIEEIKSDTNKGALEPKMDRFIEDDCC